MFITALSLFQTIEDMKICQGQKRNHHQFFQSLASLTYENPKSTPRVRSNVPRGSGNPGRRCTIDCFDARDGPSWSRVLQSGDDRALLELSDEILCPKYGFKPYYVLYANEFLTKPNASGGWDLAKLLAKISDTAKFPKGAMVVIDLEDEGSHLWDTFDLHTGKPVQAVIDRYVTVLKACKLERPDLVLGYYSVVPHRGSWAYTDPGAPPLTEEVNAASKPIADAADFIAPSFYVDSKDFNLENTLRWMRDATPRAKNTIRANRSFLFSGRNGATSGRPSTSKP